MLSVSRPLVLSQVRDDSSYIIVLRLICCRTSGTLAAGLQSSIGNVAAGSLFAAAQGAAMGAGIPLLAQTIGGVVTGVVGVVVAAVA